MLNIQETKIQNGFMIEINGRLDTTNYQETEICFNKAVERGEHNILLECSGLEYISSSGLRVFLILLKKTTSINGKLFISGLNPSIQEIFDIAGFSGIFKIFKDKDEAIRNF